MATHGLFAVTVWYLYWFLKGSQLSRRRRAATFGSMRCWPLQFAIPHSMLLLPASTPAVNAIHSRGFLRLLLLCRHVR